MAPGHATGLMASQDPLSSDPEVADKRDGKEYETGERKREVPLVKAPPFPPDSENDENREENQQITRLRKQRAKALQGEAQREYG